MDNYAKISFVMPAFNAAETITEAVESIINGNFKIGDEIIIINDSSSDNTREVIAGLKKKYPFLICLDNPENKGCPTTRNIGIRVAKNPLIFNLDADDVLIKHSVKRLKNAMIKEQADIVAFGENRFFKHENPYHVTHKWISKSGILTLADYLAGPITPGGNFLYTKASWEKIGGYWEYGKGLHEYWGFTLKQLANNAKMYVLPKSYYLHRYNKNSLFVREGKTSEESSLMATKMILNFANLLNDEDVNYIKSETGSRTWFEEFSRRPLRLKNGQVGKTGTIEMNLNLAGKIVKRFPWLAKFSKKKI
jgi:glycosyltransferase involved in cell wall biosynthesis